MEYIRTKDGIYEVAKEEEHCFIVKFELGEWRFLSIYKDNVIKQADTIEELCDEFVLLSFDDKPTVIGEHWGWSSRFNHAKILKEEIETREKDVGGWADVYGAIWTDKGLIYVAKMNEKGELELL